MKRIRDWWNSIDLTWGDGAPAPKWPFGVALAVVVVFLVFLFAGMI